MNTFEDLNTKSALLETLPDTAAEMIFGGGIAVGFAFDNDQFLFAIATGDTVNVSANSSTNPWWPGGSSIFVSASGYSSYPYFPPY